MIQLNQCCRSPLTDSQMSKGLISLIRDNLQDVSQRNKEVAENEEDHS